MKELSSKKINARKEIISKLGNLYKNENQAIGEKEVNYLNEIIAIAKLKKASLNQLIGREALLKFYGYLAPKYEAFLNIYTQLGNGKEDFISLYNEIGETITRANRHERKINTKEANKQAKECNIKKGNMVPIHAINPVTQQIDSNVLQEEMNKNFFPKFENEPELIYSRFWRDLQTEKTLPEWFLNLKPDVIKKTLIFSNKNGLNVFHYAPTYSIDILKQLFSLFRQYKIDPSEVLNQETYSDKSLSGSPIAIFYLLLAFTENNLPFDSPEIWAKKIFYFIQNGANLYTKFDGEHFLQRFCRRLNELPHKGKAYSYLLSILDFLIKDYPDILEAKIHVEGNQTSNVLYWMASSFSSKDLDFSFFISIAKRCPKLLIQKSSALEKYSPLHAMVCHWPLHPNLVESLKTLYSLLQKEKIPVEDMRSALTKRGYPFWISLYKDMLSAPTHYHDRFQQTMINLLNAIPEWLLVPGSLAYTQVFTNPRFCTLIYELFFEFYPNKIEDFSVVKKVGHKELRFPYLPIHLVYTSNSKPDKLINFCKTYPAELNFMQPESPPLVLALIENEDEETLLLLKNALSNLDLHIAWKNHRPLGWVFQKASLKFLRFFLELINTKAQLSPLPLSSEVIMDHSMLLNVQVTLKKQNKTIVYSECREIIFYDRDLLKIAADYYQQWASKQNEPLIDQAFFIKLLSADQNEFCSLLGVPVIQEKEKLTPSPIVNQDADNKPRKPKRWNTTTPEENKKNTSFLFFCKPKVTSSVILDLQPDPDSQNVYYCIDGKKLYETCFDKIYAYFDIDSLKNSLKLDKDSTVAFIEKIKHKLTLVHSYDSKKLVGVSGYIRYGDLTSQVATVKPEKFSIEGIEKEGRMVYLRMGAEMMATGEKVQIYYVGWLLTGHHDQPVKEPFCTDIRNLKKITLQKIEKMELSS